MRPHLTTLNCGLGRDSIAMLCLLAERQLMVDGEHVGPEAVDAVLFADTGAEWPHTYALLPRVAAWCAGLGLPFYHVCKPSEAAIAADEAGWFWALSVQHPELYAVAVAYEAAALARHPKMFVCGGDPQLALPEKVVWWRANNPGAQVEQVLRKDYHRGCRAVNPAQGVLIESTAAPERHHLVQRLFGALSSGEADPEMYRQLQGALERAGLRAAAEQARDAHALAKIAERRPAPAPVASAEHLQLFEEVA